MHSGKPVEAATQLAANLNAANCRYKMLNLAPPLNFEQNTKAIQVGVDSHVNDQFNHWII